MASRGSGGPASSSKASSLKRPASPPRSQQQGKRRESGPDVAFKARVARPPVLQKAALQGLLLSGFVFNLVGVSGALKKTLCDRAIAKGALVVPSGAAPSGATHILVEAKLLKSGRPNADLDRARAAAPHAPVLSCDWLTSFLSCEQQPPFDSFAFAPQQLPSAPTPQQQPPPAAAGAVRAPAAAPAALPGGRAEAAETASSAVDDHRALTAATASVAASAASVAPSDGVAGWGDGGGDGDGSDDDDLARMRPATGEKARSNRLPSHRKRDNKAPAAAPAQAAKAPAPDRHTTPPRELRSPTRRGAAGPLPGALGALPGSPRERRTLVDPADTASDWESEPDEPAEAGGGGWGRAAAAAAAAGAADEESDTDDDDDGSKRSGLRDAPAAAASASRVRAPAAADDGDDDAGGAVMPCGAGGNWAGAKALTRVRPEVAAMLACQPHAMRHGGNVNHNPHITDLLDELVLEYKSLYGPMSKKALAFRRASSTVGRHDTPIRTPDDVLTLEGQPYIGKSVLAEVRQLIAEGRSDRLEGLKGTEQIACMKLFMTVHGFGQASAKRAFQAGLRTIDDLRGWDQLTDVQRIGLKYYNDTCVRIPRAEVEEIFAVVRDAAVRCCPAGSAPEAEACGSFRRGKESSADVDVLITHRGGGREWETLLAKILAALREQGFVTEDLNHRCAEIGQGGPAKAGGRRGKHHDSWMGIVRLGDGPHRLHRRLDIKVYCPEYYPFALLYFTGSDYFNRSIRHYAKRNGLSLSDHGIRLTDRNGKKRLDLGQFGKTCKTEQDVFEVLGLDYVDPRNRGV